MLNALIVAIVAASAVWVYLDATKHKIGKIRGSKGMLNMSAGAWGVVTLGLWIIGFPTYLIARNGLITKAKVHPIEVSRRTVKAIMLAVIGGMWLLATLASVISSWSADGSTTGNASKDNGRSWFDKATSAISTSSWELNKTNSGIDGEVLTATRTYSFEPNNAAFVVEVSCKPVSRKSGMTIQSFVGSIESPTELSAFTAVHLQNGSMPVARVKFKDGDVLSTPLYTFFALGEYANKADFIASSMLGDAIPMLLEIGNGAGTFELEINRSSEVEQVLAACGQDQASLAQEKAEQQREQAKSIVLAELEHACSATGSASAYDTDLVKRKIAELSNPPGAAPEIEMDCEKSAPEALATFNDSVDQHYSAYIRLRGSDAQTCSREEFMTSLMGLDGGVNIGAADLAFFLSSQSLDCELEGAGPSRHGIPDESGAAAEATASSGSYSRNSPRQRMQAESDAAGDAAVQAAAAADGD